MSNEGSNITVGDAVLDGRIDQIGEESDAVLEICVDDLHDTGAELQNTDIGRLFHLGAGIEQTIGRDTCVGINYRWVNECTRARVFRDLLRRM